MTEIIFLGNGPLADAVLNVLSSHAEIIFHARTKEDLETVKDLKISHPDAHAVLASFGVMIKSDVLNLFEPEGILNVHPSLLPDLRGASPIESAILRGDNDFSVSIMKLVAAMDAGPVYYQTTLHDLPLQKFAIYNALADAGAIWLIDHIDNLPDPVPQSEENVTFCNKFSKSDSPLTPEIKPASRILREIIAYEKFPKSTYAFFDTPCIIHSAHLAKDGESPLLPIVCSDGKTISVDTLQPLSRKAMDAKSFLNGLKNKAN